MRSRIDLQTVLLTALIGSLAILPLKFVVGQYSLFHVLMLASVSFAAIRFFGNYGVKINFCAFDVLIILYLVVSAIYSFVGKGDGPLFVLLKTGVYYIFFISIRVLLWGVSKERVYEILKWGGMAGLLVMVGTIMYVILVMPFSFSGIGYYELTYNYYSLLSGGIGNSEDFSSADIMRNTLGECFAFYSAIFLIVANGWRYSFAHLFLAMLFTISTFSRRAFLALLAIFFVKRLRNSVVHNKILSGFVFPFVLFVALVAFAGYSLSLRQVELDDESRRIQYSHTLAQINDSPVIGTGYTAKIDGKYVHNFVLASWYMSGIVGVLLSLLVVFYLIFGFYNGFVIGRDFAFVLAIPLIGLMVGSTVEGIFGPVSWLILGFYFYLSTVRVD